MNFNKKTLIVANWKTSLTYHQSVNWLIQHTTDALSWSEKIQFILCPETLFLLPARMLLPSRIAIGAQNCSAFPPGKSTGKVSAKSLAQGIATYCIVNHSEAEYTQEHCTLQIEQLTLHKITPILCISSSEELFQIIQKTPLIPPETIFAFEPAQAIGKKAIPVEMIKEEILSIKAKTAQNNIKYGGILYGGGVNSSNSKTILNETSIDGFLLGRASSDFQALQKIVSSC